MQSDSRIEPSIPDSVLEKIIARAPKYTTPKAFRVIFEDVKNNSILAWILSRQRKELEDELLKLSYAKIQLHDDLYNYLWEERIKSPEMTLDKIRAIKDLGTRRVKKISAGDFLTLSDAEVLSLIQDLD